MSDEPVRIQKYLSQAGRASRREAERLMESGRVSVNGEVVRELGQKVVPGRDVVAVDGVRVDMAEERWILLHKPPGVLTTRSDPHGGRTVYDLLPEELHGLTYVGRL
ncbi:MAG: S4 domain-containing protein, partial [Gemmatimonadota bacterium]|nr:S4 domain-containing protein [Gemmatimonadota bacterium]